MYSRGILYRVFKKIYYILIRFYYKFFTNIKMGKRCRIEWSADILGNIIFGDDVYIGKDVVICGNVTIGSKTSIHSYTQISTMKYATLIIGNNCHIGSFNILGSSSELIIEDYALFAAGVKVVNANHGIKCNPDNIIMNEPFESNKVVIERNCWLGFDVNVIMGGGNWQKLCNRLQVSC